jgi:hypothetical protein
VAPDKPIDSAVLTRMKQFMAMNKMKKIALRVGVCSTAFLATLFHCWVCHCG